MTEEKDKIKEEVLEEIMNEINYTNRNWALLATEGEPIPLKEILPRTIDLAIEKAFAVKDREIEELKTSPSEYLKKLSKESNLPINEVVIEHKDGKIEKRYYLGESIEELRSEIERLKRENQPKSDFDIILRSRDGYVWDTFQNIKIDGKWAEKIVCANCKGTYPHHPDEDGHYLIDNWAYSNDGWRWVWFCCSGCLVEYIKKNIFISFSRAHRTGYIGIADKPHKNFGLKSITLEQQIKQKDLEWQEKIEDEITEIYKIPEELRSDYQKHKKLAFERFLREKELKK